MRRGKSQRLSPWARGNSHECNVTFMRRCYQVGNAVHNCIVWRWSRLIRDENAFRISSYWGKIRLEILVTRSIDMGVPPDRGSAVSCHALPACGAWHRPNQEEQRLGLATILEGAAILDCNSFIFRISFLTAICLHRDRYGEFCLASKLARLDDSNVSL